MNAPEEFEHLIATQGGALPDGNQASLLNNGDAFFPATLEAARAAQASVNVELYIFAKGQMAERFVEAVCARAREGVEVQVLVDPLDEEERRRQRGSLWFPTVQGVRDRLVHGAQARAGPAAAAFEIDGWRTGK